MSHNPNLWWIAVDIHVYGNDVDLYRFDCQLNEYRKRQRFPGHQSKNGYAMKRRGNTGTALPTAEEARAAARTAAQEMIVEHKLERRTDVNEYFRVWTSLWLRRCSRS